MTQLRDDPMVLALYAWRGERLARRHLDGEALLFAIEQAEKAKRMTLGKDQNGKPIRTIAFLKTTMDGIDTRAQGGIQWLRDLSGRADGHGTAGPA